MHRASPLAREAALSALAAASLAAVLAWLGPPGSDLAAHAYQRALYLKRLLLFEPRVILASVPYQLT